MTIDDDQELSDEEKHYREWVFNNLYFIKENKQHIPVMKKLYIDGYAAGWQAKKEYQAKEWMQK